MAVKIPRCHWGAPGHLGQGPPPFSWTEMENPKGFHHQAIQSWKNRIGGNMLVKARYKTTRFYRGMFKF